MSGDAPHPGLLPFLRFAELLRRHGFAASPGQTLDLLAAVDLLRPERIEEVRRAAAALYGPPPERRPEFDALFRIAFLGQELAPPSQAAAAEEELALHLERGGLLELAEAPEPERAGRAATRLERLRQRTPAPRGGEELLADLHRRLAARLPRRRSRRRVPARHGRGIDLGRSLRRALREDGELVQLRRLGRRTVVRRLLVLIDVSGSMQAHSEPAMRMAHVLARVAPRVEVFTLGTRLTRVTRALAARDRETALARTAATVPDWDGGTRLGDALSAFLAIPRCAGFARDAWVLIVSDGLERGDPRRLVAAVERLSRLAWRLSWLTPLAADPEFRPEAGALRAVLPYLDDLADGSSLAALCRFVLGEAGRPAA